MKDKIFIVLYASMLGSLLASSFLINSVFSVLQYCILLLGILLFIAAFGDKRINKNNFLAVILIACIIIYCFLISIDYKNFVVVLMFIMMLSIFVIYRSIFINEKQFFWCSLALALLLIYLSTTGDAYRTTANYGELEGQTYIGDKLTLGFNNPNETGIVLYYSVVYLLYLYIGFKGRRVLRFIILLITIRLCYLLYLTECRSCMFAVLLCMAFYLFYRNKKTPVLRISKTIVLVLLLTPLFFSFIYPIASIYFANSEIMFLGKPLFSGREILYAEQFQHFFSYPLLGNIKYFHFENALNGYLTILFNTGIVGFLFYFIIVYRVILDISKRIFTTQQLFSFSSILGVYLIASSESVVLTGGGRWYVLMLSLFILADKQVLVHKDTNFHHGR